MPVTSLAGAGLVVSRKALDESGWTSQPLLADRVGGRLVSGGDVEIVARLAATGRGLWYHPACRIQHVIPTSRIGLRYLLRLSAGLGAGSARVDALTWHGSRARWVLAAPKDAGRSIRAVAESVRQPLGTRAIDVALTSGFEAGRLLGRAQVTARLLTGRCDFFAQVRPEATPATRLAPGAS